MTIEGISNILKEAHQKRVPIIIAVEGFGGAGKSTFAAKLQDELGDAYVVAIDDFFLKEKISDADKSNFDRKRLEKQVLQPIRSGRPAAYQRLEYDTNTLSEFVKVPKVKYLIIEGVSTFHPSISAYMDYKVWVDTPRDVAKERMAKRDKKLRADTDELWEHWTKTYQDYKDLYHPEAMADFVFHNGRQF